jgi:hypothetical protein
MPQQFLHDFEFRAHASQQRRIRVTKRVPADAFLDSNSLCNRPDVFPQDRLPPIRSPTPIAPAGKNPIIWLRVNALFSPVGQSIGKAWMNGHGLLR